jgi:phosphoglycolate phosphatase-like HAD superfamily hydrolase
LTALDVFLEYGIISKVFSPLTFKKREEENMKRQKAKLEVIIFDCDGTLRSASWDGLMAAYIEIIKSKGKNPRDFFTDLTTFKVWFDMNWHKNVEKIDGVPDVEDPELNSLFHKHYDPYVKLFPWTEGLLKVLSKKYHLAILSASSVQSLKKELGDVARFFDPNLIVGAETVKKLKPHPEGLQYILEYLQIKPEHALIIGDAPPDYEAGVSAGIWTGMVGWGLCELDSLRLLDAEMHFEHPSELFLL